MALNPKIDYYLSMFLAWILSKITLTKMPNLRGFVAPLIFVLAIFATVVNCHALGFSNISIEESEAECCSLHEIEETSANATFGPVEQSSSAKVATAFPLSLPTSPLTDTRSSEVIVDVGRGQRLAWVWAKSLPFSKYKGFPTYFFATRSA